jgi:hypothetical protein
MILEAPSVIARSSYCKIMHSRLAYVLSRLLQIRFISPSTTTGSVSHKTRCQLIPAWVTCPGNSQGM